MTKTNSEYWKEQVFQYYDLMERLAHRRFPLDENTALEAYNYVLYKLPEDDWQRVRKWSRKSNFIAFLCVVVRNLIEDFAREKFGRCQPEGWIKTLGNLWIKIHRWLCCERMSVTDVEQSLTTHVQDEKEVSIIEDAIDTILIKVSNCPKIDPIPDPLLIDIDSHYHTPEEILIIIEVTSLLEAIRCLINDVDPSVNNGFRLAIVKFCSQSKLSSEERLLLKQIYQEGLNVSTAGQKFKWNPDQTHGRHRRLMERIRKAIEKSGLSKELRDALADMDNDILASLL